MAISEFLIQHSTFAEMAAFSKTRLFFPAPPPPALPSPFKKRFSPSISLPAKPYFPNPHLRLLATVKTQKQTSASPLQTLIGSSVTAAVAVSFALVAWPLKPALAAAPVSESEYHLDTLTDDAKLRAAEDRLAANPDDVEALRSLMEIYIKSNRLIDAVAIIDRLITLEPDEKELCLLKAHVFTQAGDAEAAKQLFQELLSANPVLVEAYHGLVMAAYESDNHAELDGILKRVEAAMETCRKEKKKEDLRDLGLLVAQIKVVKGKYEDALEVYDGLIREEPKDFRPYLCKGIIYSMLMKKDKAEEQFDKYRMLVPREHPYAEFYDENMIALKLFSQIEENKRRGALKS